MGCTTGQIEAANEEWIQIRIPIAAKERLRAWAERSISWIARRLIMQALDAERDRAGERL